MIVTCSNCDTSFQLDESRVPAQGIRVRCSRCKQSFFLPHPSASRAEAVDAVAQQAVRGRSAKTPDATQDLPTANEVRKAAPAKAAAKAKAAPQPEEVDNEDEWVFNRDVPAEDGAESGSETDLSADASAFENAAAAGAGVATREESVFGSVDDYSSLVGEESAPDALVEDAAGREALVGRAAGKPSRGSESAHSGSDDLGDPESWDFTADSAAPGAVARPAAGSEARRSGQAAKPSLAAPVASFDESDYAEGQETSALALWTGRLAQVAGWATTLLLVGIGLANGFGLGSERRVQTHPALDLAPLRVEAIDAGWLETARAGRLFLVSAELRNASSQPAPARLLEVALLDSLGQPLPVEPALAGIALAEADLRELATPELLAEQLRAARALAASVIGPGESLVVQAFFPALPDAASRYRLLPSDRSLVAAEPEAGPEPSAVVPAVPVVPVEGPPPAVEPQPDPLLDL